MKIVVDKSLSGSAEQLQGLLERARAGDRQAQETLMFTYEYGQRPTEDGKGFRPYTAEEKAEARRRIMGDD